MQGSRFKVYVPLCPALISEFLTQEDFAHLTRNNAELAENGLTAQQFEVLNPKSWFGLEWNKIYARV